VIVDRYFYDALVDFAVNFDSSTAEEGLFKFFPRPAQVIVLDVSTEMALSRKADIPSARYIDERRPRYLRLAERHGWPVIDASQSTDEVRRAVAKAVFGE
jgi:thymidylate kinase